jgi:hypothetical protein
MREARNINMSESNPPKSIPLTAEQIRSSRSAQTKSTYINSMNLETLRNYPHLRSNARTATAYKQRVRALSLLEASDKTDALLLRRSRRKAARLEYKRDKIGLILSESAEIGVMKDGGQETVTQQNVISHDGEEPVETSIGVNRSDWNDGSETKYNLDNFFERPVTIYDGTWTVASNQDVNLDVWNLWSLDPTIRSKLSNYAYFQGNLHLKISITGTPFHYGKVILSYIPYPAMNQNIMQYDNALTGSNPSPAQVRPCYIGYLSQQQDVEYISIGDNEPVELCIPFMAPKASFRLFNKSSAVITNSTEFADFEAAGQLRISTVNAIQIANEDFSSAISINVYAYMTEVNLSVPTATNINITAEANEIFSEAKKRGKYSTSKKSTKSYSKSIKNKAIYDKSKTIPERLAGSLNHANRDKTGEDEYEEPGPVSQIATAVSTVSNLLSDVPIIGRFAKATGWAAGKIGSLATMFGWSKPVLLEKPVFTKQQIYTNGAVCSGSETISKLSVDPKQEVTIDPSLCTGSLEDELALSKIASTESFLCSTTWTVDDVALTDYLFESCCTPMLHNGFSYGSSSFAMQPTAMAFAATPFSWWRGSITFRIEVVCSKFHRGKLLIMFEPNIAQYSLARTNITVLNQQNSVILDIQESQDIEFTVEWASDKNFLAVATSDSNVNEYWENSGTAPGDVTANETIRSFGIFSIQCLNELVQPTDASVVPINIYVKCNDLNVGDPSAKYIPDKRRLIFSEANMLEDTIVPTGADNTDINLLHFGEKILSFRTLLKRYQGVGVWVSSDPGSASTETFKITLPIHFPASPDMDLGGSDYMAAYPNIINYLRYAYLGLRGGMRYRVRYQTSSGSVQFGLNDYPVVSRKTRRPYSDDPVSQTITSASSFLNDKLLCTYEGTIIYHLATNGGVEFEIPYYSPNLFEFSSTTNLGKSSTEQAKFLDDDVLQAYDTGAAIQFQRYHSSNSDLVTVIDSAIAEDFSFLRFTGAPLRT